MKAAQKKKFATGNEMVAEAARVIQFHFMGYYPITPSTEIAQLIDAMKARGEVSTVLLAADGEHGAAGACFGASTGGGRVLNATSANGFLYSLEQLPVQAGTRLPMVLNLVTRSVSGPLDIRCDHSDLMYALQTGWIILAASTPQAVYDMNILAVKLGEHPEVRLPVMVVSDGFFTSHQRSACEVFEDAAVVQEFLGPSGAMRTTLDPRHPITVGPYMNDPDLINNKFQLHRAHEAASRVYQLIEEEYAALTGRRYPALERYQADDAEVALFLLNSAAETAKDAVDARRSKGEKVGLLRPNILRPFPARELKEATHKLQALVIGERADTPGSEGGPLSHEVQSVLLSDHHCDIRAGIRIYGLGGKLFTAENADAMLQDAFRLRSGERLEFGFVDADSGRAEVGAPEVLPSLTREEVSPGLVRVEPLVGDPKRFVRAIVADPAQLALRPKRIAPGHGACPGCGIFSGLDQFFKGIEGDVVVLYHTGCAMVVTTDFPFSAHRVTYVHNLFQNGAPTLSGLVEMFAERQRRGEIPASEDITFVMITGDGGMDIGMGPTIGTALRNHHMIVLEYDNQGYMNTGGQLSYSTPYGKETATSHVSRTSSGKTFHHKDTAAIMAATGIPYVFTAVEGIGTDLVEKAAKAQWFARNEGLAFGKILISCPLNWQAEEKDGFNILSQAVNSCFFPLYEIQRGLTTLSFDPDERGARVPLRSWLAMMGRTRHLLTPEHAHDLARLEAEVERRWTRLKEQARSSVL